MNKLHLLVTVASWENRFIEGFKKNLETELPKEVVMFFYKGYEDKTIEYRSEVEIICKQKAIKLIDKALDFFEPLENWNTLKKCLKKLEYESKEVLIDITTMPRETIWSSIFFLEQCNSKLSYVYYRPDKYNPNWLSRDPAKPRLLYKLSGIAKLNAPTFLFITAGYDYQRLYNLLYFFEPQKVVVAINDSDDRNKELKNFLQKIDERGDIEIVDINPFSADNGYEKMETFIKKYIDEYNIIFASLGPKPSAISIYKLARAYPEVGLCYIPCREFNPDYSSGVGEKLISEIKIPVINEVMEY